MSSFDSFLRSFRQWSTNLREIERAPGASHRLFEAVGFNRTDVDADQQKWLPIVRRPECRAKTKQKVAAAGGAEEELRDDGSDSGEERSRTLARTVSEGSEDKERKTSRRRKSPTTHPTEQAAGWSDAGRYASTHATLVEGVFSELHASVEDAPYAAAMKESPHEARGAHALRATDGDAVEYPAGTFHGIDGALFARNWVAQGGGMPSDGREYADGSAHIANQFHTVPFTHYGDAGHIQPMVPRAFYDVTQGPSEYAADKPQVDLNTIDPFLCDTGARPSTTFVCGVEEAVAIENGPHTIDGVTSGTFFTQDTHAAAADLAIFRALAQTTNALHAAGGLSVPSAAPVDAFGYDWIRGYPPLTCDTGAARGESQTSRDAIHADIVAPEDFQRSAYDEAHVDWRAVETWDGVLRGPVFDDRAEAPAPLRPDVRVHVEPLCENSPHEDVEAFWRTWPSILSQ
eukprot:Opistho-1_new@13350